MLNSLATSFLLFVEEFLVEEGFAVIPSSEEYNLLTLSQMDTLNRNTHTHLTETHICGKSLQV